MDLPISIEDSSSNLGFGIGNDSIDEPTETNATNTTEPSAPLVWYRAHKAGEIKLFEGTAEFWKLLGFFTALTFSVYILANWVYIKYRGWNMIGIGDSDVFVFLPTAAIWLVAVGSAIMASSAILRDDEVRTDFKRIVWSSASLPLGAIAIQTISYYVINTMTTKVREKIVPTDFWVAVMVFVATSALNMYLVGKIWGTRGATRAAGWLACAAYLIAATIVLRFIMG